MKRIGVFCASARGVPQSYLDLAYSFGEELGKRGFDLVWGGCHLASMGAIARGVQTGGGAVIGVVPASFVERELAYEKANQLIVVSNLSQRKQRMKDLSDAFVILPGGVGALDEFVSQLAETVIEARHGLPVKKIAVLNWENFYDDLERLLEKFFASGFADESYRALYRMVPDIESVFEYLNKKAPR